MGRRHDYRCPRLTSDHQQNTSVTICAVVPTYNRKQDAATCVEALLRQTRPVDEIILVDNASTDGTEEMVRRHFTGVVTYVRLPENRGGSGGFHEGMRRAWGKGHEWIWCLDSDAIPLEDTLEKLCAAEDDSGAPVVAKTCPARDPVSGHKYPTGDSLDPRSRQQVCFNAPGWQDKTLPVDLAYLCCLLVRADAAREGGFGEPGMFIWYDDLMFSLNLRRHGRILHVGAATVIHPAATGRFRTMRRHGRSRIVADDYWKQYYLFRNSFIFRSRCFGLRNVFLRHVLSYLRLALAILVFDDSKLYRLRILTKALVDGLAGRLGRRVEPSGAPAGSRCGAQNLSRHCDERA